MKNSTDLYRVYEPIRDYTFAAMTLRMRGAFQNQGPCAKLKAGAISDLTLAAVSE